MSRLLILLCGLAAVFAGADVAAAEVRWYRYALDVQTGDTIYVEPLAPAVNGRRYRVETDGGDRVVRVATFIDARQVSEVIYRFAPGGAWPTGYDYWASRPSGSTSTVISAGSGHARTSSWSTAVSPTTVSGRTAVITSRASATPARGRCRGGRCCTTPPTAS
jgi:hypothetical protein